MATEQAGHPAVNRRWLLARRPRGALAAEDFAWTQAPVPTLGEGEVLVRVLVLSADPTQRGWIGGDTYLPAVRINEVVRSLGFGRVIDSRHPGYAAGDLVSGLLGWQDYALIAPGEGATLGKLPPGTRAEDALGVLGLNGWTAYFGLLDIGRPQPGETVVVSGAAGATGALVGQIARIKGCRVIGIAGGPEKCRWVTETAGFDAAVDYKAEDVAGRLAALCPNGIDVYFDNVGGAILEAALGALALHGRIVLCGGIAHYNDSTAAAGPANYLNLIVKRGRMEGFVVLDYAARIPEAVGALAGWLQAKRLELPIDMQHGLENAPATLQRLFDGRNHGKQLLRVAD
jgi:NADPH-dependent curcumin reductase CurA